VWWMYTGFFAAFYLAVAAWAVITSPSNLSPTKFVHFLILPLLVVGFSVEGILNAIDDEKALRMALQHGLLTRRRAFFAGLAAGVLCVVAIVVTWQITSAISRSSTSMVVALILSYLEVLVCSGLGIAYLVMAAKRTPGHCPKCGYDLRASPTRCPECGSPVGDAPVQGRQE
jgi:hypothetical protein